MMFRQLYDEHFRFVRRALRQLGVPESEVSDALQDVFVVVHRKLGEFEGRGKLTTWLFGICQRVALDRRRRAHVRHEVPTEGELVSAVAQESDARPAVESSDARAMLERVLSQMPHDQRIVFVLFELEEMTGDEIAELLKVPVGTVRSRLRLARECFGKLVARLRAKVDFPGVAFATSEGMNVEATPNDC